LERNKKNFFQFINEKRLVFIQQKMAKKHRTWEEGHRTLKTRGNVDVHKHVACREVKNFFTSLH